MTSRSKRIFWYIYFTALILFGTVYIVFREQLSLIDWILFVIMVVISPLTFFYYVNSKKFSEISEEDYIVTKDLPTTEKIKQFVKSKNWKLTERGDHWIIKTPLTFGSWGEIITIYKVSQNDIFKLKITSRPRLETTMVDYGKNKDNIAAIKNFLAN